MAQMQLMQAQTEKTKAEAENIAGGEKEKLSAEIKSILQGNKSKTAKAKPDAKIWKQTRHKNRKQLEKWSKNGK